MSLHLCVASRRRGEIKSANGEVFDYAVYVGPPGRSKHEQLKSPRRWSYHGCTLMLPRTRMMTADIEQLVAMGDIMAGRVAEKAPDIKHVRPPGIFPVLLVCDENKPSDMPHSGLVTAPAVAMVILAAKCRNPVAAVEGVKSTEQPDEGSYAPCLRTIYLGDKVMRMDGKLVEHYRRVFHDDRPAPMLGDVL